MRIILPESGRARKRAVGGTFASAIAHVAIIGATIAATGWTAETRRPANPPREVLLLPPSEPPTRTPPPNGPPTIQPSNVTPTGRPPVITLSFQIGESLPPINTIIGTVAIDSFVRMPLAESGTGSTRANVASETPMTAATVERIVIPSPGNAPPRYPPIMVNAGVEGEVIMRYVVDTLGRVEPESVRAMRGDRPAFERAVRDALERMAFVPAEAGGRKVRQLVEQTFTFALGRQ